MCRWQHDTHRYRWCTGHRGQLCVGHRYCGVGSIPNVYIGYRYSDTSLYYKLLGVRDRYLCTM